MRIGNGEMSDYDELSRKRREAYRKRRREEIRKQQLKIRFGIIGSIVLVVSLIIIVSVCNHNAQEKKAIEAAKLVEKYNPVEPELDVQLLDINEYSRPGIALEKVNGIVIHYTANPGTSAEQNRDYFNGLANSKKTKASSHFVIGLDGEIVQCIPCNEIAYASNDRNSDTISIECCIEDDSGKFNEDTYKSLVELTTWLMGRYDLDEEDVIRHYDVTGKNCPKYYVEHEDAWETFKTDLTDYIEENGVRKNDKSYE